jgi:hypothetical protein
MVVWGVVSSEIEQVIEFFESGQEAERMLPRSSAMSPIGSSISALSA